MVPQPKKHQPDKLILNQVLRTLIDLIYVKKINYLTQNSLITQKKANFLNKNRWVLAPGQAVSKIKAWRHYKHKFLNRPGVKTNSTN